MTEIESRLHEACPGLDIRRDEPLSEHTTFKVGGPARLFVSPRSSEELVLVISEIKRAASRGSYLAAAAMCSFPIKALTE